MMTERHYSFAVADLWELVSEAVPTRTALVCGSARLTFAELDDRASRLAGWLTGVGVGPGSWIGVQLRNRVEHVETMLAAYKLRAVPVNINYRLGAEELRYLYSDGALVGVVHDDDLTPLVEAARAGLPGVGWTLPVGPSYQHALSSSAPLAPVTRSSEDIYALYTGGTTGHPKAVEWRMEDAFFACVGGGDPTGAHGPVSLPTDLTHRVLEGQVFLPAPPLVHAAGLWTSLRWLLAGCTVVLTPKFDPAAIWDAIAAERVTVMNIVGDAMARPLLDVLPAGHDLTCLRTVASGGAPLSPATRERFLAAFPWVTLKDSYGSSETGVHGWAVHTAAGVADGFSTVETVLLEPRTRRILDRPAGPALVARRGRIPLRYRGDPEKSAATFLDVEGERYALTGDLAEWTTEGTLRLIGRGSQCINSGGEKVFPEEVEQVLRDHVDVADAAVVGVADERWGQQVVAVVAARPGGGPAEAALREHCRARLASYKVPKRVLLTPTVQRTVAGKVDYRWATARAAELLVEERAAVGTS